MTKQEKFKVVDVWVILNVLGGILDEEMPESYFPKGRLNTAQEKTLEIGKLLDGILATIKDKRSERKLVKAWAMSKCLSAFIYNGNLPLSRKTATDAYTIILKMVLMKGMP